MHDSFFEILKEEIENSKSEKYQYGKTQSELHTEFKKVRHLLDSTAVNRYAKSSTSMNPLGGLWS